MIRPNERIGLFSSVGRTNYVIGKTTTLEYWEHLGQNGVPFEVAKDAQDVASAAHNAQETPLFAKSMEAKAIKKQKSSK